MDKIIWKLIPNYEKLYKINQYGAVFSIKSNKMKKAGKDNYGYYRVNLYKDKTQKLFRIHRLLAICFLPSFDKKLSVDHIDGDRTNNSLSNLRMVTKQENCFNAKGCYKSSKHKGIYLRGDKKKWVAQITYNYKNIYLGSFDTELEAATSYNIAALKYQKQYAKLNKGSK